MRFAQKYLEIVRKRGECQAPLKRVYRNMRTRELFLLAYSKIYSNKGALTKGVDPDDTVDGMSIKRIDNIINKLKSGTYRFKPVRRTHIPKDKRNKKKNGKKRPLGLPGWNDKLVQEVMRIILEAYYEPQFRNSSHGFRPNKGCHTALSSIYKNWTGIKWFIEGDIRGCFDNLDFDIIIQIIGRKIKDQRFLKLLKQLLKAGYVEDWKYHQTYSGAPQGGILSPLISNIVLNELDQFVEDYLIPKYTIGDRHRKINPEYSTLREKMKTAKRHNDIHRYKQLSKARRKVPVYDPNNPCYRRLRYVRYADDFILGFVGSKEEAEAIKEEIRQFLKQLKLEMSPEKTLITHAATEKARFLNYHITTIWDDSKTAIRKHDGVKTRSCNGHIRFEIPKDVVQHWKAKVMKKGKPIHRSELIFMSDYDIISTYESELQGLINYYTMVHNLDRLRYLRFIHQTSLMKTLAAKYKTKTWKLYPKYRMKLMDGRKVIGVTVPRQDKKPLVALFGKKPIRRDYHVVMKDTIQKVYVGSNELIKRMLADVCELCGSRDNVQAHHIRKLKDLKRRYAGRKNPPEWVKKMIAICRKTLFVCYECHCEIHRGQYDGVKITNNLLASCVR